MALALPGLLTGGVDAAGAGLDAASAGLDATGFLAPLGIALSLAAPFLGSVLGGSPTSIPTQSVSQNNPFGTQSVSQNNPFGPIYGPTAYGGAGGPGGSGGLFGGLFGGGGGGGGGGGAAAAQAVAQQYQNQSQKQDQSQTQSNQLTQFNAPQVPTLGAMINLLSGLPNTPSMVSPQMQGLTPMMQGGAAMNLASPGTPVAPPMLMPFMAPPQAQSGPYMPQQVQQGNQTPLQGGVTQNVQAPGGGGMPGLPQIPRMPSFTTPYGAYGGGATPNLAALPPSIAPPGFGPATAQVPGTHSDWDESLDPRDYYSQPPENVSPNVPSGKKEDEDEDEETTANKTPSDAGQAVPVSTEKVQPINRANVRKDPDLQASQNEITQALNTFGAVKSVAPQFATEANNIVNKAENKIEKILNEPSGNATKLVELEGKAEKLQKKLNKTQTKLHRLDNPTGAGDLVNQAFSQARHIVNPSTETQPPEQQAPGQQTTWKPTPGVPLFRPKAQQQQQPDQPKRTFGGALKAFAQGYAQGAGAGDPYILGQEKIAEAKIAAETARTQFVQEEETKRSLAKDITHAVTTTLPHEDTSLRERLAKNLQEQNELRTADNNAKKEKITAALGEARIQLSGLRTKLETAKLSNTAINDALERNIQQQQANTADANAASNKKRADAYATLVASKPGAEQVVAANNYLKTFSIGMSPQQGGPGSPTFKLAQQIVANDLSRTYSPPGMPPVAPGFRTGTQTTPNTAPQSVNDEIAPLAKLGYTPAQIKQILRIKHAG